MGKLFVISGSSGVGKGTVIKRLLEKNPDFELSISWHSLNLLINIFLVICSFLHPYIINL